MPTLSRSNSYIAGHPHPSNFPTHALALGRSPGFTLTTIKAVFAAINFSTAAYALANDLHHTTAVVPASPVISRVSLRAWPMFPGARHLPHPRPLPELSTLAI